MYVVLPDGVKVAMPKYYRDRIFTEDEKEAQLDIIQNVKSKELIKMETDFKYYYSDQIKEGMEFWEYLQLVKDGQNTRFYNQKNKRKL